MLIECLFWGANISTALHHLIYTLSLLLEIMTDFIFLGSKITLDCDCSHEIKRWLLLGRKAMTNLDRVLKSRDITLPIKVHLVKAMVFPVAMYRCESWTIKKVEHWKIDTFKIWWWRRLSRVFSNNTVQKHQFFGAQLSLWSNFHIHTRLLEKP